MSMKPKEALIKDGTVETTLGAGRMNAAQIARCKELAAMGWDIEGYSVSNSTGSPVVERTTVSNVKTVSDIPDETMPEDSHQAYVYVDGKPVEVGMRTVCNFCRRSLCYGLCSVNGGQCVVWVDHQTEGAVQFKSRTTPKERWY